MGWHVGLGGLGLGLRLGLGLLARHIAYRDVLSSNSLVTLQSGQAEWGVDDWVADLSLLCGPGEVARQQFPSIGYLTPTHMNQSQVLTPTC